MLHHADLHASQLGVVPIDTCRGEVVDLSKRCPAHCTTLYHIVPQLLQVGLSSCAHIFHTTSTSVSHICLQHCIPLMLFGQCCEHSDHTIHTVCLCLGMEIFVCTYTIYCKRDAQLG